MTVRTTAAVAAILIACGGMSARAQSADQPTTPPAAAQATMPGKTAPAETGSGPFDPRPSASPAPRRHHHHRAKHHGRQLSDVVPGSARGATTQN
ncbi:hypothetical protein KGY14_11875 [Ameyamaea chiangmaiensis]|nr:hypothetical protein [Ameyamaea chiangmaiensis]MBS4075890.1 hypothetical protein [Ameyamaea chiangmaiensis]